MKNKVKKRSLIMALSVIFIITTIVVIGCLTVGSKVLAADNAEDAQARQSFNTFAIGAAAFTTVGGTVAAAVAVSLIGTSGLGVMAEKPELFGRIIVFVGLAEGLAIYGLIVSIMILSSL